MRKYYLFIIRKNIYTSYKDKRYTLYKILENLYNMKNCDFLEGFNVYNKICLPFDVKILKNYFKEKIKYIKINKKVIKINNLEETYLNINYACSIIKTNYNVPSILKVFNIYNKYIFICDFKNKDYFWLNEDNI